jgi:alkylhydroperoxidase/carboxymuconolactone decarboxylase family protein YurZ
LPAPPRSAGPQERATREEILETLDVAVLMGGGPAHAFSKIVLKLYDEAASK